MMNKDCVQNEINCCCLFSVPLKTTFKKQNKQIKIHAHPHNDTPLTVIAAPVEQLKHEGWHRMHSYLCHSDVYTPQRPFEHTHTPLKQLGTVVRFLYICWVLLSAVDYTHLVLL